MTQAKDILRTLPEKNLSAAQRTSLEKAGEYVAKALEMRPKDAEALALKKRIQDWGKK